MKNMNKRPPSNNIMSGTCPCLQLKASYNKKIG